MINKSGVCNGQNFNFTMDVTYSDGRIPTIYSLLIWSKHEPIFSHVTDNPAELVELLGGMAKVCIDTGLIKYIPSKPVKKAKANVKTKAATRDFEQVRRTQRSKKKINSKTASKRT